MPCTYHLLTPSDGERVNSDLLIAGDGVYCMVRLCGISIPCPLVVCDIRGLLPLASLIAYGQGTLNEHEDVAAAHEPVLPFAPSYSVLVHPVQAVPVVDPERIYQYVIAREGVFVLAGCPGLEVLMPITPPCTLPGLASVTPYVRWTYPRVGEGVVRELFDRARAARDANGQMIERLFYLTLDGKSEESWRIHEPEQDASSGAVTALATSEADETALLEGHSHHDMRAYFSPTDNHDELMNGGFKVYFVLGRIHAQPQLRVRICVHGYAWEIPASLVFMLPPDVEDCVVAAWEQRMEMEQAR